MHWVEAYIVFVHICLELWGRKVEAKVLIARWDKLGGKVCKLLTRQKFDRKLSAGTANHAKHLHPHTRRPSPVKQTREIPATDEIPSQSSLTTRWIACDGPAVSTTCVERVCVHALCHRGGLRYSLLRLQANSTGRGITNLVSVLLCAALAGFAVSCEGCTCLLPLLNTGKKYAITPPYPM